MKRILSVCPCTLALCFWSGLAPLSAQTLSVTDGLQLWLRADAGVTVNAANGVTEWDDQSGNANNALQTVDAQAPTRVDNALNNHPVLRFDGQDDFLDVADSDSLSGAGDMSTFFVVKFDDFATFRAVWGKTAANIPAPTDIYAVPGSGVLRVYRGDGTVNNLASTDSAQALRANTYLVLGFDVAGDRLTHYLNNQENGSGPTTLLAADADNPLKIGTRNDFVTRLKGDLAELLIYNRALDATERGSVFDYLQTKYNLLNLPPTVTLAATPPGPNVNVGSVVTLTATPIDLDGTIARVDFLAGGNLIGSAVAPPFALRIRMESAGSVQFTARAVDNLDGTGTSAAVSLTSGPAGPTDLPVTSNLQLWLRADGGVSLGNGDAVLEWADQSGNANNAAQADENLAPVLVNASINGKPALRFDGNDDYLEAPDSDSLSIVGDITSLYVLRFDDFATFRAVWAKTINNLPAPTDIYTLPGSGTVRIYRGDGTLAGIQSSDGAQPYPAGSYILAGFDQAGTTFSHYLNGQANGSSIITVTPSDLDTPLRIGTRADLVTKFKGDMAELLIYDRALSTSERRAAERYLIEKYGLAPLVSTTNAPPTVAVTGPLGQILTAPGNATITATASDADGAIASVQFFANGVVIGTDTTAPYQASLTLTYGGRVTVTAVATDNIGATTTSAAVELCVQGPGAPAGLVGYWPLDGNGTAVVGVNGNLVNAPVATDDRNATANGALAFDGTLLQRVEIPGGGGLNGATMGTISLWAKWTGPQDGGFGGSFGAVFGRQANGLFSDNIINLSSSDPDSANVQWRQNNAGTVNITSTAVVGNNNWHHIAVTFTDTTSELFVDGVSDGTGGGGVLHNNSTIPLAIGAWAGDGDSYASASVDDVAVWNRVLTADEIQTLAQQTRTPLNLLISPDCLSISRTGDNVTVRWGSASVLQQADDIAGPWADVNNATSPHVTTVQGAAKYYRLRSQ
ncbi:MAG TPA: LamG-like jellyroll fold domain-containing protein [Verrucomicrobiae bacterium]|nr:LamG-like jellyroll fold domain-containing protein [Verrucomicrobiae bacterium]